MNQYCAYYQANLVPRTTLHTVNILKSFDHLCFDRTLDPKTGLFEFFVPIDQEPFFLKLMAYFEKAGSAKHVQKRANRLAKDV